MQVKNVCDCTTVATNLMAWRAYNKYNYYFRRISDRAARLQRCNDINEVIKE